MLKTYSLNYLFIGWIACLLFSSTIYADPNIEGPVDQVILNQAQQLLNTHEDQIDFLEIKLVIDQIIDPTINIEEIKKHIDVMIQEIHAMGPFTTSLQKKDALRQYLYDKGSWNQSKVYTYDFDDPKGINIQNKLLGNYLKSREGNCVSMPILFLILGQKLGLNVTASTAPLHVLVKYTDDETGYTFNLETTSGAHPARDIWYKEGFHISDLALKQGAYLDKLSKRETVAVMINTLLQYYFEQKMYGQVIALAKLMLKTYPKSVSAIIYISSAYNELLKEHNLWQYRIPSEVPEEKRRLFKYITYYLNGYHDVALQLGWQPPTAEQEEAYLEKVKEDATK